MHPGCLDYPRELESPRPPMSFSDHGTSIATSCGERVHHDAFINVYVGIISDRLYTWLVQTFAILIQESVALLTVGAQPRRAMIWSLVPV